MHAVARLVVRHILACAKKEGKVLGQHGSAPFCSFNVLALPFTRATNTTVQQHSSTYVLPAQQHLCATDTAAHMCHWQQNG